MTEDDRRNHDVQTHIKQQNQNRHCQSSTLAATVFFVHLTHAAHEQPAHAALIKSPDATYGEQEQWYPNQSVQAEKNSARISARSNVSITYKYIQL